MVDTILFQKISTLPTLKPCQKTNKAFSELVQFCLTAKAEDITLGRRDILKLRGLSAKAETEMEHHWAKRIITSAAPDKELTTFWYYENYNQLVELEYSHLSLTKHKKYTVLFVGGGPLPLTAILLCRKYRLACTILEKDAACYKQSRKVVEALGLEKKITIVHIDAHEYSSYTHFDVVYVASLVGIQESEKQATILSTYSKMKEGSLLLCRSSHGARTLLYPPVPYSVLSKLPPSTEVRPSQSIINSFIILQKT